MTAPTALADLVACQEGSVVSRVLLKNGGGSVTLFAFAKGERLSEHATPGEALRLPAGVPHALRAARPFRMLRDAR